VERNLLSGTGSLTSWFAVML